MPATEDYQKGSMESFIYLFFAWRQQEHTRSMGEMEAQGQKVPVYGVTVPLEKLAKFCRKLLNRSVTLLITKERM